MKKTLFLILLVILAGVIALPVYAAVEKNVSVTEVSGNVEMLANGAKDWQPVSFGTMLGSGDTIKTGADSYADLNFSGISEAASVRVDANSTMKIDSYIASSKIDQRKISLDLSIGEILVKAYKMKDESQFQVRTPTSVVGVRGTGFKVRVASEQ